MTIASSDQFFKSSKFAKGVGITIKSGITILCVRRLQTWIKPVRDFLAIENWISTSYEV